MSVAFVVLIAGLFFIWLEFFLPGAILGSIGALLTASSILLVSVEDRSPWEVIGFAIAAIGGVMGVIFFALSQIRKSSKYSSFYLESDQEGFQAASFDPDLIGKEGVAFTDLRPGGKIMVEETMYPAMSLQGYLDQGCPIVVCGWQGDSLMVRPIH